MRSNKNQATRFLLRRNLFIGVIVFLTAFYMMPFWALSNIPQVKSEVAAYYAPDDLARIAERYTPLVSSNVMTYPLNLEAMVMLYGGLGFMTALMLMRHQFSRRQSMLYAALPDKRETDFLRRLVGYGVLCLAPILLNFLLYLLVVAANGLLGYVAWDVLLPKFGMLLLINVYGFAVGMLASVLTGTYWAAILAGAALVLCAECTSYLWYDLASRYWYTLVRRSYTDALLRFSPAYSLYKTFYKPAEYACWPGVAASVLALVLSFALYRIRRTERAEHTLAFMPLHSVLGFVFPLTGGTLLGMVLMMSFGTELSLVGGMILGAVLTFGVCRMVFNQRFCGMLKQWYLPAASAAVLVMGVMVLHTDTLGYDRYLPEREALTAISYRPQSYDSDEIITLSSDEALDAAYEWCMMMQDEVSGYEAGMIGDNSVFRGSDVVVTYQIGDRRVYRHYPNRVIRTAAQPLLKSIIESDDYRQSLIDGYHLNGSMEIYRLYINPAARVLHENTFYEKFGMLMAYRSYERAEDGETMDAWMAALKEDILSRTFEEKQEAPIFNLDLSIRNPDNREIGYKSVDIYPGDVNVLRAIYGEQADAIVNYATGGYLEDEGTVVLRAEAAHSLEQLNEMGLSFKEGVERVLLASSADEAKAWLRQSQNVSADEYYYKPYRGEEPMKRLLIYQMAEVEKYAGIYGYTIPESRAELYDNQDIPTWMTLDYIGEN